MPNLPLTSTFFPSLKASLRGSFACVISPRTTSLMYLVIFLLILEMQIEEFNSGKHTF